jgi:hypothetical protein
MGDEAICPDSMCRDSLGESDPGIMPALTTVLLSLIALIVWPISGATAARFFARSFWNRFSGYSYFQRLSDILGIMVHLPQCVLGVHGMDVREALVSSSRLPAFHCLGASQEVNTHLDAGGVATNPSER